MPRMKVARMFGLSEPAVRRHFHLHLPENLVFEDEDERLQASRELQAILGDTIAELRRQVGKQRDRRRTRSFFRALRVLHPLLELRARMLGR
jgi:hypothetical protein